MKLRIVGASFCILAGMLSMPAAHAESRGAFNSPGQGTNTPVIIFDGANPGNALTRPAATPGLVNGVGGSGFLEHVAGTPAAARFEDGIIRPAPEVPELSTWAMMLAGFGAIGLAMRREPVRVAFA